MVSSAKGAKKSGRRRHEGRGMSEERRKCNHGLHREINAKVASGARDAGKSRKKDSPQITQMTQIENAKNTLPQEPQKRFNHEDREGHEEEQKER